MTPNKLVWIRQGTGRGTWYVTECGRFTLSHGRERGTWILCDRHTKDSVTPMYNRTEIVYSLVSGHNKAARWFAGK